jgi:hypothetical protein
MQERYENPERQAQGDEVDAPWTRFTEQSLEDYDEKTY